MKEKLQMLRERSFELFEQGRERFLEFWNPLNVREKVILGVAGGVFSFALLVFVGNFVLSSMKTAISGPQISTREIQSIYRIVDELQQDRMEIRRFERLRAEQGPDFNLEAFLREEAQRAGLEIRNLRPAQATTPIVSPEETYLELQLDLQSPLTSSLRFLHSVDQTLGARIVSLTVKPRFADRQQAEISATIAHRELP